MLEKRWFLWDGISFPILKKKFFPFLGIRISHAKKLPKAQGFFFETTQITSPL